MLSYVLNQTIRKNHTRFSKMERSEMVVGSERLELSLLAERT